MNKDSVRSTACNGYTQMSTRDANTRDDHPCHKRGQNCGGANPAPDRAQPEPDGSEDGSPIRPDRDSRVPVMGLARL